MLPHFVFIIKEPSDELDIIRMTNYGDRKIKMEDSSAEIFGAFNDLAKATGGLTESSANMAVALFNRIRKGKDGKKTFYFLFNHFSYVSGSLYSLRRN